MPYVTNLADILRGAGLKVVEQAGWKTRGHGPLASVQTIVCHHTAGPATGNYPSLGTVQNGRPGLPGPLSQLGLGRDGTWYVIAAGLAYHAGATKLGRQSNSNAIGIEAEARGTGDKNDWPAVQMDSYAKGCAALAKAFGLSVDRVEGHKEICSPSGRKIDPSFNMTAFRAAVKTGGTTTPPEKKDEFLMALSDQEQQALLNRVEQIKTQQDRIEARLNERVPDVGTTAGLTLSAALGRLLTVLRRTEGRVIANKALPVTVDVNAGDLAEAFGELLKTLPAATAKAVLDGASARLKA